jgi:hypothetical protein
MAKPGCRVRIDGHLRNLAVSQPIGAMGFQRRSSALTPGPFINAARRQGGSLIAEQTFQKQACVSRNPFLPE